MPVSHSINGNYSLNGNGNLRASHAKPKRSRLKDWEPDLRNGILVYGTMAILIGGLTLWNHYHPQPEPLPDPRTVQIQKTINNLYDAIDTLNDELPPKDDSDDYIDSRSEW